MKLPSHICPVPLAKAYRLVNHGPTILVSARFDGQTDVMAAAWACGLDFDPPKITVVIDKIARTRALVEGARRFVVQIPTVAQAKLTHAVGTTSLHDDPHKLEKAGVTLMEIEGCDQPLVAGAAAWLVCKLLPEPHIQETYDLFIAEVTEAWADDRVFRDGHWLYEQADPALRSLHYIAGGHFYAIGDRVDVAD